MVTGAYPKGSLPCPLVTVSVACPYQLTCTSCHLGGARGLGRAVPAPDAGRPAQQFLTMWRSARSPLQAAISRRCYLPEASTGAGPVGEVNGGAGGQRTSRAAPPGAGSPAGPA